VVAVGYGTPGFALCLANRVELLHMRGPTVKQSCLATAKMEVILKVTYSWYHVDCGKVNDGERARSPLTVLFRLLDH